MVVLQARAKCFVLQRIRVHYVTLQFNFNVQCYQNISRVLLTSAFTLLPPCTCGFGFRKKSDAVCGFLAYFCAVLRFLDPLAPPSVCSLSGLLLSMAYSLLLLVLKFDYEVHKLLILECLMFN